MTTTLKRAAAMLAGAICLAACNDKAYLTEVPYSFVGPQNFYQTAADAASAVNGAYATLMNSTGADYYGRNFVMLVEYPAEALTIYTAYNNERALPDNFGYPTSHSYVLSSWTAAFNAVNAANTVVGRVPAIAMDTTLRARYVAEAKFLRALNYFNLVRLFGDVPLRTEETTSLDSLQIPRTPAADVYAQIVRDLQDAIAVLPAKYTGADVGRATAGAARTLLVKVYLQRAGTGVTTGAAATADHQAALALARQVVAGGTYALVPDVRTLWDLVDGTLAEQNTEVIFDLQCTRVTGLGGRIGLYFAPLQGAWETGPSGSFEAESTFYASFSDADKRKAATFAMTFPRRDGTTATWSWSQSARTAYGADSPYLKKFVDPTLVTQGQEEPNYIILRYADLLLMQAEAANEAAGAPTAEAYQAVNAVRTRAGLAGLPAGLSYQAFKDSVFVERRKELVGEGPNAHFDSQRNWAWAVARIQQNMAFGKVTNFATSKFPKAQTTLTDKYKLFPVPQRARDLNPQLTQNPGW